MDWQKSDGLNPANFKRTLLGGYEINSKIQIPFPAGSVNVATTLVEDRYAIATLNARR